MIVLDASVLIAALDATNAHHTRAADLLYANSSGGFGCSPLTRAETLVGPARHGLAEQFEDRLHAMGVATIALPGDAPGRLARLRATTGARLPDCCVLLSAQQTAAPLATFGDRLHHAANSLGLTIEDRSS